ncbi:MAG: DinB family protein [Dehalococcoidia bacterium]
MDRAAIQELFDYTGWAWDRIERVIDGLPEGTFEKPVPGSGWPAIRDCFEHFVGAYDGWINEGWGLGPLIHQGPETIATWGKAKAYRRQLREAFRHALAAPDEVLFDEAEYEYGGGPETWSRAHMLTNLLLHERGHHGDLNTLFHQLGVQSYIIDYRYFVTKPTEFEMDEDDEDD